MSRRVSPSLGRLLMARILLFAGGPPLAACDDVVLRDAAFAEPRDIHRLLVIGKEGDPDAKATGDRLISWIDSAGNGLNIEVSQVAADAPDVRWEEHGMPSVPPALPVVVLAGRPRLATKGFVIDHWEPGPGAGDLEILRSSQAREALSRELGQRLAAIVFVPRASGGSQEAEKAIAAAVKAWGEKSKLGLAVVRADRLDPRERLLISFAGIAKDGADWATVAFGRGKFMPPLEGADITEEALGAMLEPLLGECTCLRSPSSLGVDVPLVWDAALDRSVILIGPSAELRHAHGLGGPEDVAGTVQVRTGGKVLTAALWTLVALVALSGIGAAARVWSKRRER